MEEKKFIPPSMREAFTFWLKLGFISFGGPVGQISIMHEYLVVKKKWISESRYLNALNYCMVLPGPEAQQLATYLGWLFHGTKGGLIAGLLFILPSLLILIGLSSVYVLFGKILWVSAIFEGLKPAIVAIVILTLFKISKKSLHSILHYLIAISSFIAIFFFKIPFPAIILTTVIIGIIVHFSFPNYFQSKEKTTKIILNESEYLINNFTSTNKPLKVLSTFKVIFIGCFLWVIPIGLIYSFSNDFNFWNTIVGFFTKASLVTFGGAYAVLPYVAQVSVEKYHWLSSHEMIDGLALGETTPGPLIMVLVFVGYLGGYHHFQNSIAYGIGSACVSAYYTFLASFIFIFTGAPFIEKTHKSLGFKSILTLISAAVVGVILNLTIYFAEAVIFKGGIKGEIQYINFAWLIISVIALHTYKVNFILWIGISTVFGLLTYLAINFLM
jgi:chromate transporter